MKPTKHICDSWDTAEALMQAFVTENAQLEKEIDAMRASQKELVEALRLARPYAWSVVHPDAHAAIDIIDAALRKYEEGNK